MNDERASNVLLDNPLREPTRKVRRVMLALTLLGFAIVYGDLVPTGVTQLGLKFDGVQQESLITIVLVVLIYHLVVYSFLGLIDYLDQRKRIFHALYTSTIQLLDSAEGRPFLDGEVKTTGRQAAIKEATARLPKRLLQRLFEPSERVVVLRRVVEFWVPLLFCVGIVITLVFYDVTSAAVQWPRRTG
jgi:hypothetical protein